MNLELYARKLQGGAGIYEAGNPDKCYTKLFVTDGGRVMPVNHRVLTEDDLLEVFNWGRLEAEEDRAAGVTELTKIQIDPPDYEDTPF